jgi:hypothetical protein
MWKTNEDGFSKTASVHFGSCQSRSGKSIIKSGINLKRNEKKLGKNQKTM